MTDHRTDGWSDKRFIVVVLAALFAFIVLTGMIMELVK